MLPKHTLIDVEDVALGHTTKLRWNETGKWLWSDKLVQPPIVARDAFARVQAMVAGRAHAPAAHKPHRARHPYALRGCVWCGICERRMQGHWVREAPYYRCRFPAEYALANRVQHPVNVYLREDQLIGEVDGWLAREFAQHRMSETLHAIAQAQHTGYPQAAGNDAVMRKIAECDRKLAQYRAALLPVGFSRVSGGATAPKSPSLLTAEFAPRLDVGDKLDRLAGY